MKLNGTRLKKRSPRKITKFKTRNGGQNTNLQLTRVNQIACVNKKYNSKEASQQNFLNKNTGILAFFRRITRPFFIPLLVFPFTLQHCTTVSERKVPFSEKKSNVSWSGPYPGPGWENPDRWSARH